MIDLDGVAPRLYDTVTPVVDGLVTQTDLAPENILLVGAACRDILHAGFGHTFSARATTDTDVGIAVGDWAISESIHERFTKKGSNGIRYQVGATSVDIMPFGPIEKPAGISRPAARNQELVVFGFRDVHERALPLPLPGGHTIRLPQPAGYAALKMRALIDRSAHHHWADAQDLALAAYWYQNSPEIADRLYETEAGYSILASLNYDVDLAAVSILRLDIADQLSAQNHTDLVQRWAKQEAAAVAQHFTLPVGAARLLDQGRRKELVHQLYQ